MGRGRGGKLLELIRLTCVGWSAGYDAAQSTGAEVGG